jgi:hypothetical protein
MTSDPLSQWNARIIPPSQPDEAAHAEYFLHNAETPPSAVLVFHGIGEEVRFETLGRAASLILVEARERGAKDISVVIRPVPKDIEVSKLEVRAELSWTEVDATTLAQAKRQVHVYEAYWAPLTAGEVSYMETMGFLVVAGWNGLQGVFRSGKVGAFNRWLFGGFKEMKTTAGTLYLLAVLLFLVVAVWAIIAMAASAAAGVAKQAGTGGLAGFLGALNFIYGQIQQPWNIALQLPWKVMNLFHGSAPVPAWLGHIEFSKSIEQAHWWEVAFAFLVWGLLVWGALQLRSILTSYAGSLVAYLSPYKDSKWDDLRSKIQQVGLDAGRLILDGHTYTQWIPKYEKIVYVAHSLGSVIAYDTLNALINSEAAKVPNGAANPAVERSKALITLGSPLDKTAFLFRVQFKVGAGRLDQEGELRETMVCAVQPLIADYDLYRFKIPPPKRPKWINLWSRMDVVSGKLSYYDDPVVPESAPQHVQNLVDPAAWKPILAHNQYWTGKLLRQTVYDELF